MNITSDLLPQKNDRIVCVKVGRIKRENLYEMARKYWKVKLERVTFATHVLAIVDGHVETVYIPQEWKYTDNEQYLGRCEFIGKEDVKSAYIGKSVKNLYGKSANSVLYSNM